MDKYKRSSSLEQIVRDQGELYAVKSESPLAISPLGRARSKAHRKVPIALIAVTCASAHFTLPFLEALKFLSEGSERFRVVLVGDAAKPDIAKRFGWAVEHIHSERDAVHRDEWLGLADARVRWVARVYGAQYVDAPTSTDDVPRLLGALGAFFGIDRDLVHVALEQFARLGEGTPTVRFGWRGWLDTVPVGDGRYTVDTGFGQVVNVHIHRGLGDGVLVRLGKDSDAGVWSVDNHLRSLGWSSVYFEHGSDMPREPLSDAVAALRDAFSDGGYLAVVAPTREAISVLGSSDGYNAAVWWTGPRDRLSIRTDFGRTLVIPEADVAGVLTRLLRVRRIARTLAR